MMFLSLLSCNNPANRAIKKTNASLISSLNSDAILIRKDSAQISAKEDSIFDSIKRIPEILLFENLLTQRNRKLEIWTADTILRNNKSYVIFDVGEDNGFSLVSEYHFACEINKTKILYYDTVDDDIITLTMWRQKENKMRYQTKGKK